MAPQSLSMAVLLVVVVVLLSSGGVNSCSLTGRPDPTLLEQVSAAHVVVYGKILRRVDMPRFPRAYVAEMLVYCSLKDSGGEVPAVINITEAGTCLSLHIKCLVTDQMSSAVYKRLQTRPDCGISEIIAIS